MLKVVGRDGSGFACGLDLLCFQVSTGGGGSQDGGAVSGEGLQVVGGFRCLGFLYMLIDIYLGRMVG